MSISWSTTARGSSRSTLPGPRSAAARRRSRRSTWTRDGLTDLAVPCRFANGVVVLLARPPGPPPFSAAPRVGVGTRRARPWRRTSTGTGISTWRWSTLGDDSVSLLRNDGGVFTEYHVETVGRQPSAIVAADLNRDGRVDLIVNSPGETTPGVSVLLGSTTAGQFLLHALVPVGTTPDDLAAGDFDRDGDVDLAVCDRVVNGLVHFLRNDGSGALAALGSTSVGDKPTALAAADLDRDGDLDLGGGERRLERHLVLLATARRLQPPRRPYPGLRRTRARSPWRQATSTATTRRTSLRPRSAATPCTSTGTWGRDLCRAGAFDAPNVLLHVAAADLNGDGRPDLVTAAGGLSVFRGRGGARLRSAGERRGQVYRHGPRGGGLRPRRAARRGDRQRRQRRDDPDAAPPAPRSGSTCRFSRRAAGPACRPTRARPWSRSSTTAEPRALRDRQRHPRHRPRNRGGGSRAGRPGFPPGGGRRGHVHGLANALTIDRAGRRYRLSFSLGGVTPATTRSFTLGAELAILGSRRSAPAGPRRSAPRAATTSTPGPSVRRRRPSPSRRPSSCRARRYRQGRTRSRCRHAWTAATPRSHSPSIGATWRPRRSPSTGSTSSAWTASAAPSRRSTWAAARPRRASGATGRPPVSASRYRCRARPGRPTSSRGRASRGRDVYYVVVTTNPTCGTAGTVSSEQAVTVVTPVPGRRGPAPRRLGAGQLRDRGPGRPAVGQLDRRRRRGPGPLEQGPTGQGVCVPPADTPVRRHRRDRDHEPGHGRQGWLRRRRPRVRHGLLLQRLRARRRHLVARPDRQGPAVQRRRLSGEVGVLDGRDVGRAPGGGQVRHPPDVERPDGPRRHPRGDDRRLVADRLGAAQPGRRRPLPLSDRALRRLGARGLGRDRPLRRGRLRRREHLQRRAPASPPGRHRPTWASP